MKKLLSLLLVLTVLLSFAACGGGNTETPGDNEAPGGDDTSGGENGGGTAVDDINSENWAQVVALNFGLELSLPDGWSVKEVSSPNHATNVKLFFNVGGDATYTTFGEALFAEMEKDAVGDITAPYDFSDIYTSFAEAQTMTGIASFRANVSGGSDRALIINYYDNGTNVEITIQRSGNWN